MISPTPLSLREAFARHYSTHRLKRTTVDRFRHGLNCWERHTDDPPVQLVTAETFDGFRKRANGIGAVTVERTINLVLTILRQCASRGVIAAVPEPGSRFTIPAPMPYVVPLKSISELYLACDAARWPGYRTKVRGKTGRAKGGWWHWQPHDWTPTYWRVFVVVAFTTALRLGDLWRLKRADFTEGVLTVRAEKTGKAQVIPLPSCVVRHLDIVTWAKPDEPLFGIGSLKSFRDALRSICAAANVGTITPQLLRVAGANCWEAAELGAGACVLGHSVIAGASRYYLRPERSLENAVRLLKLPSAFLTPEERQQAGSRIAELRSRIERMDPAAQEDVLRMLRRMG